MFSHFLSLWFRCWPYLPTSVSLLLVKGGTYILSQANETCAETAGKEVLSLFDLYLKNISLEFLGATRWRDSPEKKSQDVREWDQGKQGGVGMLSWHHLHLWGQPSLKLCKPANSLCSRPFCNGICNQQYPNIAIVSFDLSSIFYFLLSLHSYFCFCPLNWHV